MVEAILGLGANIGNPKAQIEQAIEALQQHIQIELLQRSSVYQTEPWGMLDQPAFTNVCVLIETKLEPHALLAVCLRLEEAAGRERREKWGPRTLDIDILTYGNFEIMEPGLVVPHPHILERKFVLQPLMDLGSDRFIKGMRVSDALENLNAKQAV